MCQFKFDPADRSFASHIKFMYDDDLPGNLEEIKSEYEFIPKPDCIPDQAVRTGTYAIRERGFYQEVERYKDLWVKKGRWDNRYMQSRWELFPQLADKEYEALYKVPQKVLNKKWLTNLRSYLHWKELRKISRDVRKTFLKD